MRTSISFLINMIMTILPETRCFGFKRMLWRLAGAKIGSNVRICSSCKIFGAGKLIIGDNTWIGHQTLIATSSKIVIGANVDIAPRVYLGTGTHIIDVNSDHIAANDISKDILIRDGCWICTNAVILAGAQIGKKCVVAAGAIVTSSFYEDRIMVGGVPAKKIKSYE